MSTMDNTEKTLANGDTEAPNTKEVQVEETVKTYTQDEVDNMMARMKGSISKKLLKPYEDLGDPEELRKLKADAEAKAQEEAIKRGEFEETLKELANKKDQEIQKREQIIKEYKVNTPLLDAAARYKSINPEQVKTLLSNRVRLNEEGSVEVLGSDGKVQYDDSGNLQTVDTLVQNWLSENPHFVQATPSTTNSSSNVNGANVKDFDITKLNMNDPKDRARYAEYRKQSGIN
jgi:ribonucleotide reductase alpha subunit